MTGTTNPMNRIEAVCATLSDQNALATIKMQAMTNAQQQLQEILWTNQAGKQLRAA